MIGFLYIDNDKIGEVNFKIIDESMGVIGGELSVFENYKNYQLAIQKQFEKKGVSNITDFNFRILLEDNSLLNPQGGIGITDSKDFEEIYVEAGGLDLTFFEKN